MNQVEFYGTKLRSAKSKEYIFTWACGGANKHILVTIVDCVEHLGLDGVKLGKILLVQIFILLVPNKKNLNLVK